jgi:hypothetical protein
MGIAGEKDPDEENVLQGVWEDGDDRGFVLETLKRGVEVRMTAGITAITTFWRYRQAPVDYTHVLILCVQQKLEGGL